MQRRDLDQKQTGKVRLQKILADKGVGSRRQIERMIADGLIVVNGKKAEIGQRVGYVDRVRVKNREINLNEQTDQTRILIYNKPEGEVCSLRDPKNRPTVFRNLPRGRWIYVGRLDINSSGLLLFTNDGALSQALTHPSYKIEREYLVRVHGVLSDSQCEQALSGVRVEGEWLRFVSIESLKDFSGSNRWYKIVLTEGKNREIRRLLGSFGVQVGRLKRIRYGTILLPKFLRLGRWSELSQLDVLKLSQSTRRIIRQ